jgi:tetratricopeptide (TPR) repeat protein
MMGLVSTSMAWSNVAVWFEQANKHYDVGEYEEAFQLYDSIEKMQFQSAELFYNKGNCAYKLGWTAQAVLNFEKALRINPGFEDAQHNLALANDQVADKRSEVQQKGVLTWMSAFFNGNYQLLGNITLISLMLFGVLGSIYLLSKNRSRVWMRLGIVSLIIGGMALALAVLILRTSSQSNGAIIMEPVITIYNEPSENSSAAFILHEGSRVDILEELEHWFKVTFDKKVGWIAKTSVAVI